MTDANNTDKTTSAAAETAAEAPAVEATEAGTADAAATEAAVAVAEKPAAKAAAGKAAGKTVTVGKLSAQDLIRAFEAEQITKQAKDLPEIYVGDTVRVGVRITEGNKERIQPYEGVVIAKRHGGLNETITVRRIFQGVGVERVFLLHSPQVASVKVERRGKVRRAKLFYLRDRVGKATRVKQRFDR
jgi:large subunit ribosomal protein L19